VKEPWPTVPLKSLVSVTREVVDPRSFIQPVDHYSIPALEAAGVAAVEDPSTIQSAKLLLVGDEVLISRLNPRKARVAEVHQSDRIKLSSTEFIPLRPGPGIDRRFLRYLLLAESTRQHLDARVQSVTRSHQRVDPEVVTSLRLGVPAVEEQRRVADFLDDQVALLDRAIHLRQQQLGLVSRRFHSEARRATTFGLEAGPTKPTRLAWMPTMAAKWTRGRVARSFRTGSGTTPSASQDLYFDGPYDWVNTGDLRDGLIVRPKRTVTDLALSDYSTLRRYPAGSLVIAMYGATIGRLGLLSRPACVNQACCVLYEGTDVTTLFAFYWLLAYRDEITDLAVGAGQPNISQETVSSLPLPVPAQFEQETIVAHLERERERSEALADTLTRSISLLQERKQALITTAVTCELDVATASARSVA